MSLDMQSKLNFQLDNFKRLSIRVKGWKAISVATFLIKSLNLKALKWIYIFSFWLNTLF